MGWEGPHANFKLCGLVIVWRFTATLLPFLSLICQINIELDSQLPKADHVTFSAKTKDPYEGTFIMPPPNGMPLAQIVLRFGEILHLHSTGWFGLVSTPSPFGSKGNGFCPPNPPIQTTKGVPEPRDILTEPQVLGSIAKRGFASSKLSTLSSSGLKRSPAKQRRALEPREHPFGGVYTNQKDNHLLGSIVTHGNPKTIRGLPRPPFWDGKREDPKLNTPHLGLYIYIILYIRCIHQGSDEPRAWTCSSACLQSGSMCFWAAISSMGGSQKKKRYQMRCTQFTHQHLAPNMYLDQTSKNQSAFCPHILVYLWGTYNCWVSCLMSCDVSRALNIAMVLSYEITHLEYGCRLGA